MRRLLVSLLRTSFSTFIFIVVAIGAKAQTDTSHGVVDMVVGSNAIWLGSKPDSLILPNRPVLAIDNAGNLYYYIGAGQNTFFNDKILDSNQIIKLNPQTGKITVVAGNGIPGFSGDGGLATKASIAAILAIAIDKKGNVFISDWGNARVRKIDAITGIITTVAGNGWTYTYNDSVAATSTFVTPNSLAVDTSGNLFIGENSASFDGGYTQVPIVQKVNLPSGIITRVVGRDTMGYTGDGGLATLASITQLDNIAVDTKGNLYITQVLNNVVRKITASTGIITTVAGNGYSPQTSHQGGTLFSGDGGPAISAQLDWPETIALDVTGNLYIADQGNSRIRKVDTSGIINTVVGATSNSYYSDNGGFGRAATSIEMGGAEYLFVDSTNNIYYGGPDYHTENSLVSKVTYAQPIMTSFTPTGAVVGDTITIKGKAFIGTTFISIGGEPCQ